MGRKKLEVLKANEEANRIQNRARMNKEWESVVQRIRHFCNISRRTWPHAVMYLLEIGLNYVEQKEMYVRGAPVTGMTSAKPNITEV